MDLQSIRHLYDATGPFVTVYLEGRSPAEDAAQQVRLRWDSLRRQLAEAGADDETLSALDAAVVVEEITEVQTDGRVLVATAAGVLLDEHWDAAVGAGDAAHFTEEPELGAYVREAARSVRLLVAIADQHGATVRRIVAADQHALDQKGAQDVGSESGESVHKPREGAFSHSQIQRRADEAVKQNVRGVADRLDEITRQWRPDLLVLAGEVQGRTALRDEISPALSEIQREAERGGLEDRNGEDALAEELRTLAAEVASERSRSDGERLHQAEAHDLAAEGVHAVARALEMGAVDTLLLNYEQPAVDEATLLAGSARTDARVGVVDTAMTDAVGALLRFETSGPTTD